MDYFLTRVIQKRENLYKYNVINVYKINNVCTMYATYKLRDYVLFMIFIYVVYIKTLYFSVSLQN